MDNNNNSIAEFVESTLKSVFHHQTFKSDWQKNAIIKACEGSEDIFVNLPTNAGKSLIYQLPALYDDRGLIIVVNPLIAAHRDKLLKEQCLGYPSAAINCEIDKQTIDNIKEEIVQENSKIRLLYVTHDCIFKKDIRDALEAVYQKGFIKYFVIDEAHCLVNTGMPFCRSYKRLSFLKHAFPFVPMMVLTSETPALLSNRIITHLGMDMPRRYESREHRHNIKSDVVLASNMTHYGKMQAISSFLKLHLNNVQPCSASSSQEVKMDAATQTEWSLRAGYLVPSDAVAPNDEPGSQVSQQCSPRDVAIVYCRSRRSCSFMSQHLNNHGIKAAPYYASDGLKSTKERELVQDQWYHGLIRVICATTAFGLGIDKSNVRVVVHYDMPLSLMNYKIQIGRAGRDGLEAHCRLYYAPNKDMANCRSPEAIDQFRKMSEYCRKRYRTQMTALYNQVKSRFKLNHLGSQVSYNPCF